MSQTNANNYGVVAKIYDVLGHIYSGGQIRASKQAQLDVIKPGQRVLYAGAGGGEDAVMAAKQGAVVTVVELSPEMIEQCQRRFRKEGVESQIELVEADIMTFKREHAYDVVVANFFLNVFSISVMPGVMDHLVSLLKPSGYFLISDFRPLEGGILGRTLHFLYYGAVALFFRVVSNNPFHPIYDYRGLLPEAGLKLQETRDFELFGIGPAWYRGLFTKKLGTSQTV